MTAFDIGDDIKTKQRATILAALQKHPLSTIEARERLSIQHPAARVLELRQQNFNIITRRSRCFDAEGRPHTVALYHLEPAQL